MLIYRRVWMELHRVRCCFVQELDVESGDYRMLPYVLTVALLQVLGGATVPSASLENLARTALAKVEQMRNQRLSAPLKMGVKTKPQITEFIKQRMKDEYGPALIKAEGDLLRLQGLLPANTNYGQLISGLLTEQVAGFYDHTRQELHIADWLPSVIQGPVMAHEIFHAIQDQEWGGGKLIDSKKYSHDEVLAHAALLEGDATIVMFNYQQAGGGIGDISTSPMMVKMIAASLPMQMSSPQHPVMAAAPDYMKQSLIFPYQQGFLFVAALRSAGMSWARIRDVYRDPPQSTEQILHPERYHPVRDLPSEVTVPSGVLKGMKRTWTGVAGEFHARQLLLGKLTIPEAAQAAEGWDGDFTFVAESKASKVALTLSTWDSVDDAREFAEALKKRDTMAPRKGVTFAVRQSEMNVAYAFSDSPELAGRAVEEVLLSGKVVRR